jgi:hypothetical protein
VTISSEVAVYNLALNAIGARSNVSSPTEDSREAEVCHLWFTVVRDQILAAAPWPEATDLRYLALLKETDEDGDGVWAADDPRPGYQFVYSLPSDLLHPQYLTDFSRFLVTSYSDNRRALHTNTQSAALAYTKRLESIALWNPQLQMAVVYGLASHICMPMTGKPSRAKMLMSQANDILLSAREAAANTSDESHEHIPEWIAARGYNIAAGSRFIYPYGSLLSLAGVN